jgi:hypothetical protein
VRAIAGVLVGLLCLSATATADAHRLTKHRARAEGLAFAAPFVDMLDMSRAVKTRMVRARDCRRIDRLTVRCRFHADLADGRRIKSFVRVHRQKDGLFGVYMPLDSWGGIPPDSPAVLDPASP